MTLIPTPLLVSPMEGEGNLPLYCPLIKTTRQKVMHDYQRTYPDERRRVVC